MALPRVYDPFEEMRRMQKDMDAVFSSFFEQGGNRALASWGTRAPLSDIEDRGDSVVLSAELPGMRKEDIKITIDKDSVSISAERKEAMEEKKKNYYYLERAYSGYRRSFALPHEIDPDSADAEYKDGVLRISLTKARKGQMKEVRVR